MNKMLSAIACCCVAGFILSVASCFFATMIAYGLYGDEAAANAMGFSLVSLFGFSMTGVVACTFIVGLSTTKTNGDESEE